MSSIERSLNVKAKPARKRSFLSALVSDYQLWLMILPAIIVIFIFNYIPMYGVQLAFRDFDFTKGITGGKWAGLKYFKQFFNSPMFWPTIVNTFRIAATNIFFGFPAPILLALILHQLRNQRIKEGLQTVVYMPHFISTVVMVAMINIMLSPRTGLVSNLLKSIGLVQPDTNLLGSTKTFVPVYVLTEIWQHCGWNSIIYFAALSTVDQELYDACKIDGANRLQTVRHIEIPALVPTIVILLILNMGNVLNVGFEKVFLMQNSLNLPVSEVISTYVYKIGLISNQFSFGSAVGLFNTSVNFVFLILTNVIAKRLADISLW
ncbi:MAG: sugar ABC transporter permease [Clostridiales bacterium]|nr:sugar ABC transporter permease [Clostridiales bacterium]